MSPSEGGPRFAYVAFLPAASVGVQQALQAKSRALQDATTPVDCYLVTLDAPAEPSESDVLRVVAPHSRLPRSFCRLIAVVRRYAIVERAVDLDRYETVILRYPAADPSGERFVKNHRTVLEHHTISVAEMSSYSSEDVPLPELVLKRFRRWMEKRYGGRIIGGSLGVIGVTEEIAAAESSRVPRSVPFRSVPNGIDVKGVAPTRFVRETGEGLDVAFVAASVRPWHGLDRLLAGLSEYEGDTPIRLHLIGDMQSQPGLPATAQARTIRHGIVVGDALDDLMAKMHLGVSSLGLHRNRLTQGATLKTREYVARGLPFILAYDDPDLHHIPADRPFFLRLPADDTPVDIEAVVDFAKTVTADSGSPDLSDLMRGYAIEYLDWRPKMQQYVDFCDMILGSEGQRAG